MEPIRETESPRSSAPASKPKRSRPAAGRFGSYGGRYVPETLMAALQELDAAYAGRT